VRHVDRLLGVFFGGILDGVIHQQRLADLVPATLVGSQQAQFERAIIQRETGRPELADPSLEYLGKAG
jgi:hypothetical protein